MKLDKKRIAFIIISTALMALSGAFSPAPAEVKPDTVEKAPQPSRPVISIEKCVDLALANQPNILAGANNVLVNESRVGQAQAGNLPTVEANASYNRTQSVPSSTRPTGVSSSPFNIYSANLTLKQNILDFGKTRELVKVQDYNYEASRQDLEGIKNQTAFNVKSAYYALLQAKKNLDVAEEAVKQFELHLEQAKGFFSVGVKPRFDVIRAEVDLSNSRVNLIKAQNALRIAYVNLKNAMGTPEIADFDVEDNLEFRRSDVTLEGALSRAAEARPDLKAQDSRRLSATENVEAAKRNYFPQLTGNAAYNWGGESFPLAHGWTLGATLNVPLFTGFLTKYQVAESRANLEVVGANEKLLKQNIILEVQQAYYNLREADERVPASELALRQSKENLDIANGRYAAGVGNPIEVTDAQVAYSNARTAYIQALSDYKVAEAALIRAMGAR